MTLSTGCLSGVGWVRQSHMGPSLFSSKTECWSAVGAHILTASLTCSVHWAKCNRLFDFAQLGTPCLSRRGLSRRTQGLIRSQTWNRLERMYLGWETGNERITDGSPCQAMNSEDKRWADMEVPSESFHWSSWDSRTCYPRRAFNQQITDERRGITVLDPMSSPVHSVACYVNDTPHGYGQGEQKANVLDGPNCWGLVGALIAPAPLTGAQPSNSWPIKDRWPSVLRSRIITWKDKERCY